MRQPDTWSGQDLREMFRAGSQLLSASAQAINSLNVFPVPDGDTGTNMVLTMQAAMQAANLCPDNDASAVARAMAQGALMGARGNSGVILSQILQGLAQGLGDQTSFDGRDLARALMSSSALAYKAVSQPVEGTMLTVVREVAETAESVAAGGGDLKAIVASAAREARESVARTPRLLPILRDSGVVDAGGEGLCAILVGAARFLQGENIAEALSESTIQPVAFISPTKTEETKYGYCTEFLVSGEGLGLEAMRDSLCRMGESVLVVGDEKVARVHVHTFDPGAAISYGTSLGTLRQIKIDNMADQHRDFINSGGAGRLQVSSRVSVVAVVSGEGLARVFRSLGAAVVLPGGETMNPSVSELLHAVDSVGTDEVIVLPNNPDILPAAAQVKKLATKRVAVVPSRTVPQGISALLAFSDKADLPGNVEAMTEGAASVRTGAITTAMRSMRHKDLKVRKGQIIGLVDGKLVLAADSIEEALERLLRDMDAANAGVMTVYHRAGIDAGHLASLMESIRAEYSNLEVEVVFGGQPHYDYIISVE